MTKEDLIFKVKGPDEVDFTEVSGDKIEKYLEKFPSNTTISLTAQCKNTNGIIVRVRGSKSYINLILDDEIKGASQKLEDPELAMAFSCANAASFGREPVSLKQVIADKFLETSRKSS